MTRTKRIFFCALLISLFALIFAACQQSGVYTVRLDFQGGNIVEIDPNTGEPKGNPMVYANITVIEGLKMPAAKAPVRKGYSFGGFFDSTYFIKQYYDSDMNGVRLWDKSNNATLYARWIQDIYTVKLDSMDGVGGTTSVKVSVGENMPTDKVYPPTKDGFTFDGYYDSETEGVQYYDTNMNSTRIWDKESSGILYARWLKQYRVKLDFDGGKNGSGTASVTATMTLPMPSYRVYAPSREGYAFGGYYSGKNAEGDMYYDAKMSSVRHWDIESDEISLYAYWIPSAWNTIGRGTESEPYLISNAMQLESWSNQNSTFSGMYFELTQDIALNASRWRPICAERVFAGTLDGKGYTISSIGMMNPYTYVGLFGSTSGTIKNLNVSDFTIKIVEIPKINEDDVVPDYVYAGGLAGENSGVISNCHINRVSISDNGLTGLTLVYAGGLVGLNSGTIEKSSVKGNAGDAVSIMSTNKGARNNLYVGGLVGRNTAIISSCFATISARGMVSATDASSYGIVGGLVGQNTSNTASIRNCYATGLINVTSATSKSPDVTGTYSAYLYAGGLVGENASGATIANTFATGYVTAYTSSSTAATYTYVGGLVGNISGGSVSYSFATGDITASVSAAGDQFSYRGGLYGSGTVSNGYRYSGQKINFNDVDVTAGGSIAQGQPGAGTTNTQGGGRTLEQLSEAGFYTSLSWSFDIWDWTDIAFNLSLYPRLRF